MLKFVSSSDTEEVFWDFVSFGVEIMSKSGRNMEENKMPEDVLLKVVDCSKCRIYAGCPTLLHKVAEKGAF